MLRLVVLPCWLAMAGCHRAPPTGPAQENKMPANPKPIGTAVMAADGTITMDLHSPDGAEGRLVYPRSHPRYQEIKKHLPDLRPGGTVAVPPWPD
jgi:hypothetical protein